MATIINNILKRAAIIPHRFYIRQMSNIPENTVYGGPKPQNPEKRVTLAHLKQKHKKGEPITMVTAYDYPSGVHLDTAGIDICLVGDSAAMVVHGHDTTLPISLDEMLVHCRAVARGALRPLLVGDLPFGTYESTTHQVFGENANSSRRCCIKWHLGQILSRNFSTPSVPRYSCCSIKKYAHEWSYLDSCQCTFVISTF